MLKYFQNEYRILSILSNDKIQQIYQGFLVDKEWVDNWKHNSHYETIYKQFFQNNNFNETQIKSSLIYEQTNNNLINDLNKIPDINNYILRDINKLEEELKKNKSFVLLNGEFLISYDKNINNISIFNCDLNFQNISIKKINGSYLSFKTNDNIINISKIKNEFNSKALHNSFQLNRMNFKTIINDQNNHSNIENQKLLNELNIYKRENEELKNEINILRFDNNRLNTELNNIKNNISFYQQKIQENNNEINNLRNILKEKENEINNYKIKSGKYVDFKKIMVINFMSQDQNIIYGIKCLPTDTFAEAEEKLYQIYDNYRETNNNFVCKGSTILRFKKISENNIKDGDKVILINQS